MELGHKDGKLQEFFSDCLVTMMMEVRQLTALGFVVPSKIQHTATMANRFYRQAVILKQVGSLVHSMPYNTLTLCRNTHACDHVKHVNRMLV